VDGLLFGLQPVKLGLLGQVPVDDLPHSSIDLLAREPSPQINLLHMGTVTSSQALPSARLRRPGVPTPWSDARRVRQPARALATIVAGMYPSFTQLPPTCSSSMIAAPYPAAASPAAKASHPARCR
jgi:hypothetical protein